MTQGKNIPSNIKVMPGSPIPGDDPVPEVVKYLEERLAEAKRGEIRAIATASVSYQGGISTGWVNNGNFWKLIGGIDWLKHRMHSGDEP